MKQGFLPLHCIVGLTLAFLIQSSFSQLSSSRVAISHHNSSAEGQFGKNSTIKHRPVRRDLLWNGPAPNPFDEKKFLRYVIVDQNGFGTFRTVQAAVDSVPAWNQHWIFIQINPGIYQEKVYIPYNKGYMIMQGGGRESTMITWSDTASKVGTANSATFSCFAPNFVARDISFRNGAPPPPPGARNRQAVAALVAGDMAAFYGCGFYGAQDTLFDYQGRHYYKDCYIEGSIDFIFGHAQSLFKGCELHAIAGFAGSITAQNRANPGDNSGFIFLACTISGTGMVFLGRAWGSFSRVVFLFTYMDDIIIPEGWYDWGIPQRRETVFYAQYQCYGPGANLQHRVNWSHVLTDEDAQPFLRLDFIDAAKWLREV